VKEGPDLDSFAAITDEPAEGDCRDRHERCIISLQPNNVDEWLAPVNVDKGRLEEILSDRAPVLVTSIVRPP